MKRSTFRRPLQHRGAQHPPNRDETLAARARRAMESAAATATAISLPNRQQAVAVPACAAMQTIAPVPKQQHHQNRRLLDLARGMPCLMRVPGVCNRDPATTVAAHSNQGIHGKAGARKADDHWSCWACSSCHTWLDQGPATRAAKTAAFMRGHLDQVLQWRWIAGEATRPEGDRRAARWALDRLQVLPEVLPCGV